MTPLALRRKGKWAALKLALQALKAGEALFVKADHEKDIGKLMLGLSNTLRNDPYTVRKDYREPPGVWIIPTPLTGAVEAPSSLPAPRGASAAPLGANANGRSPAPSAAAR